MNLYDILDTQPAPLLTAAHWKHPSLSYIQQRHYALATPARPLQMELQDQIVSLHYADILKFFNFSNNDQSPPVISKESLITMVRNSLIICAHPYLLIEHYLPKSLTTRDIPKRLADTSGKFQILSDLLKQLDETGRVLDICIIGFPGKMLDLIDALCMGHRCSIIKYKGIKLRDSSANKKVNDTAPVNIRAHIIGSDFITTNEIDDNNNNNNDNSGNGSINCAQFQFVINMDMMTDLDNEWIKNHTNDKTVFLELPTANSIEHIFRHFIKGNKRSLDNLDPFLNEIVAALVVLREKIGHISSGLKPAYADNLSFLRPYLRDPENVQWSLPDMPAIRKYTAEDIEKSLLSEVKFGFDPSDIGKSEKPREVNQQLKKNDNGAFFDGGYYLEKRLEKKYLANPLLGGYAHLTGISREVSSGEVLTHTLMFGFEEVLTKLGKVNCDLEAFVEFNDIRIKHWEQTRDELKKMKDIVKEKETALGGINNEITKYEIDTANAKSLIKGYENQLEERLTSDDKISEYVQKDQIKHELLLQVNKLEAKLSSSQNESKYMNEEIQRALKSIDESRLNISNYETKQVDLKSKIDAIISESKSIDVDDLRVEIDLAQQQRVQLLDQIANLLEGINNPNVRHRSAPTRNFKK